EECSVWEILKATEGSMAIVACTAEGVEACPRENGCKTLPMWRKFDKMVYDYFSRITLKDLVDGTGV
ncbi:MAG: Rrf2 family transcriptional regulator, partial [Eubacteriales bacterium]|nr:Rrf2 family transcriptional regulator [Eubacteriales bacterium]